METNMVGLLGGPVGIGVGELVVGIDVEGFEMFVAATVGDAV